MKITQYDYLVIKRAVSLFDTVELREKYQRGDFPRADRVKDLNKRYRWDLAWLSGILASNGYVTEKVYQYANSDHLDTALRKIVPPL